MPLSGNENFQRRPHPDIIGADYMVGRVYFITDGELIKIGYSGAPSVRVKHIKSETGRPLEILKTIPGTMGDERRLHAKFNHLRVRGEWFRKGTDLLAFIGMPLDDADESLERTKRELFALSRSEKWPPEVACCFSSLDTILGRLIDWPEDAEMRQVLPMALAGLEANMKWWRGNKERLVSAAPSMWQRYA